MAEVTARVTSCVGSAGEEEAEEASVEGGGGAGTSRVESTRARQVRGGGAESEEEFCEKVIEGRGAEVSGGVGVVVSGGGGGGRVAGGGGGAVVSGGEGVAACVGEGEGVGLGGLVSAPGSSPLLAEAPPAIAETYHGCRPVAAFIHASLSQCSETQSSLTMPPRR